MLNQLFMEMIRYYEGDAKRIQHFVKDGIDYQILVEVLLRGRN